MKRLLTLCAILGVVAMPLTAQTSSCAELEVSGVIQPGSNFYIDMYYGIPDSIVLLACSPDLGYTSWNLGPFGTLNLDLASPLIFPIGMADMYGDFYFSIGVPAGIPIPSGQAYLQGVFMGWSFNGGGLGGLPSLPTLEFCTTDVEMISFGGGSF